MMIKKRKSQPGRTRFKNSPAYPTSPSSAMSMEIAGAQKPSPTTFSSKTAGEIEEENHFVSRVHRWFWLASDDSKGFRDRHIENLKFQSNDQWTDDEKARVESEGRPALVINRGAKNIWTLSGLQRKARQDIDLLPLDPEDSPAAEIMEILLKHERDHMRPSMKQIESTVFERKAISGLGFYKLSYSYKRKPQGEIKVEFRDMLKIFHDPNFPEQDWQDIEWVMDAQWLSMDDAVDEWPEYEEQIRAKYGEWLQPIGQDSGKMAGDPKASKRSFWDSQTQRIRMLEVWYKVKKVVKLAVFKDGEVVEDEDRVKELEAVADQMEGSDRHMVVIRRPVWKVRVAHVFDDIVLDDMPSPLPFNELPIVPDLGYYYWKNPFGLWDVMKDPQREKNKRRSAIIEIAGRTALSGWLNKKGVGADREDLESYAHGGGVVVEYDAQMPERIDPPTLPEILVELEAKSDKEIDDCININDELRGQTSQKTVSGKAIEARQQGGLVTQEPLFDTSQEVQAYVAELMIKMIQDVMTEEEANRILGSLVKPKHPDPNDPTQALFADPELLRRTLSRAFSLDYKVVITTKPFAATHAMWKAQALSELDERKPGIVPPELFVEAYTDAGIIDKANGEKMLMRLKQAENAQQQQNAQIGAIQGARGAPGAPPEAAPPPGANGAGGPPQ